MEKLHVVGPCVISGEVEVAGSKNAALPILAAAILANEKVILSNVPFLRDVSTMIELLCRMGITVYLNEDSTIEIMPNTINRYKADYELVKTMRASILVLGPLLTKYGKATVSLPGGCAIGSRPVDLHIFGLEKLGATITVKDGYIEAVSNGRLQGCSIDLPNPSVGATENIMTAAVLAAGKTIINNAACEPEITDLANFLNSIGANISGAGSKEIIIHGVKELGGGSYNIFADRVEAGTFLIAAAMTQGSVKLNGINSKYLEVVLDKLREVGADIDCGNDYIALDMKGRRAKASSITTEPYPGFPTDLQAQWMALSAVSDGTTTISENIFENRFMHVYEMSRMNAKITIDGSKATIFGQKNLLSAPIMATDIRASASLILASLVAHGDTIIDRIYHIDRGYSHIEEKFNNLGANITRISGELVE